MKLLLDENLSPNIAHRLQDLFPGSHHVHDCGLGTADDEIIWEYALSNGYTIVSKDSDFYDRALLRGSPPKVVWVRAGNRSNQEIESILRSMSTEIEALEGASEATLTILPVLK
jgi:predicted nuclease of predicted toxin-antitoxin system